MPSPLDPFIPLPDARERFAVTVRAPAATVYNVACNFDMQSIWSVRTIFRCASGSWDRGPASGFPVDWSRSFVSWDGAACWNGRESCSWGERSASLGSPT